MGSVLLVACFSLLPSSAFAGWIATASVGASIPTFEQSNITIDGDSGYTVGGSLGLRFGDMLGVDALALPLSIYLALLPERKNNTPDHDIHQTLSSSLGLDALASFSSASQLACEGYPNSVFDTLFVKKTSYVNLIQLI